MSIVGEVVEIGEAVSRVKPGDRVAVEPLLGCNLFGEAVQPVRLVNTIYVNV